MPNSPEKSLRDDIPLDRILLESKKRCVDIASAQAKKERETYGTQDFIYGAYMGGMRSYFSDMPGVQKQSFHEIADPRMISDDRAAREARGESPTVSDWFGPGFVGYDLGYKKILSADLIDHGSNPVHTHFSAHSLIDIDYQNRVFASVAAAKRGEGLSLHTSFLRPFAGLKPYQFEPYMYVSITHLIGSTYDEMDDGSQMLIELTYMDEAFLAAWSKCIHSAGIAIVKKEGASVYKITKDAGSPRTMPDLNDMRGGDSEFAQQFDGFCRHLRARAVAESSEEGAV